MVRKTRICSLLSRLNFGESANAGAMSSASQPSQLRGVAKQLRGVAKELRRSCDGVAKDLRWKNVSIICKYPFWISGWSYGQKVRFSIGPGDPPLQPRNFASSKRYRIGEVTLATLWRSKVRFLMECWIASLESIFQSMFASNVHRL